MVAALLHVAHLDVMLLASIPIALALLVPISSTFFVRLVIGISITFCTNFLVAWLLGLVDIPFVPVSAVLFLALPMAFGLSMGWLRPRLGPLLDGGDAVALLCGLSVLVLLWLPAAGDDAATMLSRLVAMGEDNAAHLGIVQAIVIQHELLFGEAQRWSGRLLPGHTAYPPGLHVNVALVVSALENFFGTPNPSQLVRAYFYVAIGLQAIWAATTVMAIRAVGSIRRAPTGVLALVGFAAVLFFLFGPPADLLNWGFQSQVAALWMLVLELYLVATADLDGLPVLRLSLVLLAMVGTTWSWYLVSPVAWVAALTGTWLVRRALIMRWRLTLGAWVAAGIASLPPLLYGVVSGAPGYINASGGVYQLDRVLIAMLLLAALTSVVLPDHLRGRPGLLTTLSSLVAAGLFALGLHWYQTHTAGAASYFYEKLLYTLVAVAAVAAGATAADGLSLVARLNISTWRRVAMGLAAAGVLWLSTAVATTANPGRHYLTGTRRFPDVGAMHHLLVTSPPPDLTQVLFWGSLEPQIYGHDYLASRFAAAIYLRNTDLRNDFMAASAFHQDDLAMLDMLRASPDPLLIITRDASLRERLMAQGYTPADMDRITIDMLAEPLTESSGSSLNFDISPRGLLPSLFRPR
ncbi:MAG: hypothetical protein E6H92_03680 [Chloroflexi bacterium]|nr:MAG: hypothetical protein E6H92_03680 [Chloroflexota bacterium]